MNIANATKCYYNGKIQYDVSFMITIDAIWEKRNLGISCNEFIVQLNDNENIFKILRECSAEYQVVKLPQQMTNLIFPLQKDGFIFTELIYECTHHLIDIHLPEIYQRIFSSITYEIANYKSIILIKQEIQKNMFNSDRISIDPNLGLVASANRYKGWIDDLVDMGSNIFIIKYNNNEIGFFVLMINGDLCNAVLGGIFNNYKKAGFGIIMNYLELIVAKSHGCSKLKGIISSNNSAIYKINEFLKYKINPKYYIFVKHFALPH